MIATNIEQSKHLVKLGIDQNTADMHYVRKIRDFIGNPVDGKFSEPKYGNVFSKHAQYAVQNFTDYELVPAWSLSALLELMPPCIDGQYYLYLDKDIYDDGVRYSVFYAYVTNTDSSHINFIDKTPIGAAFEMVRWLKENGKI